MLENLTTFLWENRFVVVIVSFLIWQKLKPVEPFPESGGQVDSVSNEAEFAKILSENTIVVVDFYATWCPPCRLAAPVFGKLSLKYTAAKFIKIDVDKAPSISQKAGVSAMPSFQLYIKAKLTDTVVGFNQAKIESMIKKAGISSERKDTTE